jgi:hypothetical protein
VHTSARTGVIAVGTSAGRSYFFCGGRFDRDRKRLSVVAVDAANQTVTLRGPTQTVELRVRDPEQLKPVKVGDQVDATHRTGRNHECQQFVRLASAGCSSALT